MPSYNSTIYSLLMALSVLALSTSCSSDHVSLASNVPHTNKPFADQTENFQFVIIGDRTGGHRPGVFRHAIERVNQLQPEFVVGVGDLIEGYKADEATLRQEWDEFDNIVDLLDMPFFYTVGNHDVSNDVMRDLWLRRHGRDYYHFVYRDVLFISLNTEDPPIALSEETMAKQARLAEIMRKDPGSIQQLLRERRQQTGGVSNKPKLPGVVAISDVQQKWAAKVLADHPKVRWTILLMHKPAWEYDSPAFEAIEQLMQERPYTVIAGHEHYFNYSKRLERDYVTMGTTGGIWLSLGQGSFDHIAWVTMTDEGPQIANVALCGLLGTPAQTQDIISTNSAEDYCLRPEASIY